MFQYRFRKTMYTKEYHYPERKYHMKRIIPLLMSFALLAGCGSAPAAENTLPQVTVEATNAPVSYEPLVSPDSAPLPFASRFDSETVITLSDEGITVNGGSETDHVYTSQDIIYYEDRDTYESGNPYGEGTDADKHTAQEAAAHRVVNITAPGAYRISGQLSAGQIRVNLGGNAYDDPNAVVELILDNADITCTVAPAILFQNVYECDGDWDEDSASSEVDTSAAGAVLVLEGENTVNGSYVAKIFRDNGNEKKLWKQDGAIYSYMSMNVEGSGTLVLNAENEGMDTELHLTINGGNTRIYSQNDGINTNEDGVSVTTINGGSLHIVAGLGQEGDGIDSNGYLVINGGTVVSAAKPISDAGLDSDLGSYINGGTVIALGSAMDWAESESQQVTMNLQFAAQQTGSIAITREDGTVIFAYDPGQDELLGEYARQFQGAIISCGNFRVGESYQVYTGNTVTGSEIGGIYDATTVSALAGGSQMAYTGTNVGFGPGMGSFGGQMPEGFNGQMPESFQGEMPEGMPEDFTMPGNWPEDMPQQGSGQRPDVMPEGMEMPEDMQLPEGFDPSQMGSTSEEIPTTLFYMTDMVNSFSGVAIAS